MRIRSLICPIVAITIVGCSSTEPPEATPMADAVEDETTVENSETDEVEASFDIGEWVESDRSQLESIDACRIADITGVRGEAPTAPDPFSPLVLQGEQVRYGDVVVKYIEAGARDTIRISR